MRDAARYLYVHRAAEYGRILHGFSAVCMGLEYFSRWYGSELAPDPAAADMTYLVTVFFKRQSPGRFTLAALRTIIEDRVIYSHNLNRS